MFGSSQKGSNASTSTTTTNVDKSITLGGNGAVLALQDNTLDLASGASLSITSSDPEVAKAAIAASQEAIKTAAACADAVVKSQEQFVGTATGQKAIVYVVAALAALGLIVFAFFNRSRA